MTLFVRRAECLLDYAKGPLLSILALFFSVSVTTAAEYDIDPAHSFVNFRTNHLGFSWLSGRFNVISGTLNYERDQEDAVGRAINLTIDVASLDTNYAERDKHLTARQMFL